LPHVESLAQKSYPSRTEMRMKHRQQHLPSNKYSSEVQSSAGNATVAAIETIRRRRQQFKSTLEAISIPRQQQVHPSPSLGLPVNATRTQRRDSFLPQTTQNPAIDKKISSRRRSNCDGGVDEHTCTIKSGPRTLPSSHKKAFSHIKSSGYGQSSRVPKNKRYSHITSSGYGQSSTLNCGNNNAVTKGGNPSMSPLRTGNKVRGAKRRDSISSSLPNLGHKNNGSGLARGALLQSGGSIGGLRGRP